MTLEEALERAYAKRAGLSGGARAVRAAEASRKRGGRRAPAVGARDRRLRRDRPDARHGAADLQRRPARSTCRSSRAAAQQGRLAQADAELRSAAPRPRICSAAVYYDVRTAFLDLEATEQQLQAATRARELASQQLTQARDRFAAGVANNIEVVQAQEAVALATEQYISALYGFNVAKALLARRSAAPKRHCCNIS